MADPVEKFLHAGDLLESCADRIVGRGEGQTPVQIAASGVSHELHQALGEAVLLVLLARLGDFVELGDLTDSEGAPDLCVELEINVPGLANVLHVGPVPELVPLVEKNIISSSELCQETAGGQS